LSILLSSILSKNIESSRDLDRPHTSFIRNTGFPREVQRSNAAFPWRWGALASFFITSALYALPVPNDDRIAQIQVRLSELADERKQLASEIFGHAYETVNAQVDQLKAISTPLTGPIVPTAEVVQSMALAYNAIVRGDTGDVVVNTLKALKEVAPETYKGVVDKLASASDSALAFDRSDAQKGVDAGTDGVIKPTLEAAVKKLVDGEQLDTFKELLGLDAGKLVTAIYDYAKSATKGATEFLDTEKAGLQLEANLREKASLERTQDALEFDNLLDQARSRNQGLDNRISSLRNQLRDQNQQMTDLDKELIKVQTQSPQTDSGNGAVAQITSPSLQAQIPPGWVPCTCPSDHPNAGLFVNGVQYHTPVLRCPR
jgi:hypothetical protein